MLDRKVKADASRNALTVLQRYRFLFSLPRSIEKNIKNVSLDPQEEADVIILTIPFLEKNVLPFAEGI